MILTVLVILIPTLALYQVPQDVENCAFIHVQKDKRQTKVEIMQKKRTHGGDSNVSLKLKKELVINKDTSSLIARSLWVESEK